MSVLEYISVSVVFIMALFYIVKNSTKSDGCSKCNIKKGKKDVDLYTILFVYYNIIESYPHTWVVWR